MATRISITILINSHKINWPFQFKNILKLSIRIVEIRTEIRIVLAPLLSSFLIKIIKNIGVNIKYVAGFPIEVIRSGRINFDEKIP